MKSQQTRRTNIAKTIGMIVLSEGYGKNDFLRFYNSDGSLWYQFTFFFNDKDGAFPYANDDFAPFSFHPDNFLLALKCIGEHDAVYEVIVNEETGLKKFIKKSDPAFALESLEEHIVKAFAVSIDDESNPIRNTPSRTGKLINGTKEATLHPIQIEGDWLKVRWDSPTESQSTINYGWVKWRSDNVIIIEIFYFS